MTVQEKGDTESLEIQMFRVDVGKKLRGSNTLYFGKWALWNEGDRTGINFQHFI